MEQVWACSSPDTDKKENPFLFDIDHPSVLGNPGEVSPELSQRKQTGEDTESVPGPVAAMCLEWSLAGCSLAPAPLSEMGRESAESCSARSAEENFTATGRGSPGSRGPSHDYM